MDHHCPWTNNCVGYMTLKPFCLFLLYITISSVFISSIQYSQAQKHNLSHIGFVAILMPPSNVREHLLRYFASAQDKIYLQEQSDVQYQLQVELEKKYKNILILFAKQLKMMMTTSTKFSMIYSLTNFLDCVTFIATIACGVYTFILLIQTIYYVGR